MLRWIILSIILLLLLLTFKTGRAHFATPRPYLLNDNSSSNGNKAGDSVKRRFSPSYGRLTDEQRILHNVFGRGQYDPDLRPVVHHDMIINVSIGLTLTQLFDVIERDQVLAINVWLDMLWIDQFFTWTPDNFNGLQMIRIPGSMIWTPDILLFNTAVDFQKPISDYRAMISYDGTVFYSSPAKLFSFCHLRNTYFPFDVQTCYLKFGSWTYGAEKLRLSNRSADIDMHFYITNGEWDLIGTGLKKTITKYSCCPEEYSDVTFEIRLRRKTLYFMFTIFHPCITVSLFCITVFCLPPESGEKCAFGITVMLTATVLIFNISDKLPETSESFPLISVYLTFLLATASASVIFTVIVMHFHLKQRTQRRLKYPPALMRLICDKLMLAVPCCCQPMPGAVERADLILHKDDEEETEFNINGYIDFLNYYQNLSLLTEHRELIFSINKLVRKMREEVEKRAVLERWQHLAQMVDKFLLWLFSSAIVGVAVVLSCLQALDPQAA